MTFLTIPDSVLEGHVLELKRVNDELVKENAELRKALSAADTYAVCLEEELENLRLPNVSK